jgi:2,4-dienoyl-CoA reductase-like NADH-dependent reductase (Old Yellow Enzyme family)
MHPNERVFRVYERWARGGLGLIVTGNVVADRSHPESPRNIAFEAQDEAYLELYKRYAEACHLDGCKVIVQLSHAGRQSSPSANKRPKAPSAIPLQMEGVPAFMLGKPVEMTVEDIEDLKKRFVTSAVLCQKAGFGRSL